MTALLADAAPVVSDDTFKYVCGGMAVAIVALAIAYQRKVAENRGDFRECLSLGADFRDLTKELRDWMK